MHPSQITAALLCLHSQFTNQPTFLCMGRVLGLNRMSLLLLWGIVWDRVVATSSLLIFTSISMKVTLSSMKRVAYPFIS